MIPKFRAWDSLENKMRYDIGVIEFNAFDKNVSALAFNHHLDDTGYGEVDNSQSEYYDTLCFKLMQYTGLKDKNGTEIYEGDIIDKGYLNGVHDEIGVVTFGTGFDSDGSQSESWLGWVTDKGSSVLDVHEKCEVIGNVFENKNLLSEDDIE
ncbi:hypothetical protein HMPREF2713_08990 [Staphylococcus sp. HMSC059E03]|uniref:YopX family protein n=1 Tax=Staphylococcus sp. HMSC059E03 TaxID=1715192 RepID=UPI0008A1674E|nr:YopX family protein [Staphylococcus sp. HMSC059E03]OFM15732.1 hypothetical protein HMPREF2713_08990 [Staphylococcus sp. HMSC059E03]